MMPLTINIFSLIALFLLSISCTSKPSKNDYHIQKDQLDTRWIDLNLSDCQIRILGLGPQTLRISHRAPQENRKNSCEFGTSPLIEKIAPAAKALMVSYKKNSDGINIELSLRHNPSLLKKWAAFLILSPQWQKRPKNETHTTLILQLLKEGRIFASYSPLTAQFSDTYTKENLYIEKVSYERADSFAYFKTDLLPLGYKPADTIPVPLMIIQRMSR
jgi:hypothetical protein